MLSQKLVIKVADDIVVSMHEILDGYSKKVREGLDKLKDDVANEAASKLATTSPKKSGKYAGDWVVQKRGSARVVHNRKHYQLTHLLEKGHALRNGGRSKAMPHIKPVEEQVIKEMSTKIKQVIENA